jgi:hypothetical protein
VISLALSQDQADHRDLQFTGPLTCSPVLAISERQLLHVHQHVVAIGVPDEELFALLDVIGNELVETDGPIYQVRFRQPTIVLQRFQLLRTPFGEPDCDPINAQ